MQYRCKIYQGSHNDHPKSMTSGEELYFKVPPKTSFDTVTTNVLTSDMITSLEPTNHPNGPRPIFEWTMYACHFYHITHRTKCRIPQNQRAYNTNRVLPWIFLRHTDEKSCKGATTITQTPWWVEKTSSLSKCLPRWDSLWLILMC